MESCPDQVYAALRGLSEALRPRARVELATLSATFRRLGGDVHSDLHSGAVSGAGVRSWDLAYLIEQSRASILGADEAELSQYLELGRCLEGIQMVFARAFGLQVS
jgi:Zn-dependent oligopeptidase